MVLEPGQIARSEIELEHALPGTHRRGKSLAEQRMTHACGTAARCVAADPEPLALPRIRGRLRQRDTVPLDARPVDRMIEGVELADRFE